MPLNKNRKRYIQYDIYVRIKNMQDKAILFMAMYYVIKVFFKFLAMINVKLRTAFIPLG